MYKFSKDYEAFGSFTECMYDEAPEIASYSREINIYFKKGDFLEGTEIGKEKVKLWDSPYGVSVHGSTACLYINVSELVDTGILEEVDKAEYEVFTEKRYAKEVYDDSLYRLKEVEDYLDEYEPTEEVIDDYVSRVLAAIHARTNYIIACL